MAYCCVVGSVRILVVNPTFSLLNFFVSMNIHNFLAIHLDPTGINFLWPSKKKNICITACCQRLFDHLKVGV